MGQINSKLKTLKQNTGKVYTTISTVRKVLNLWLKSTKFIYLVVLNRYCIEKGNRVHLQQTMVILKVEKQFQGLLQRRVCLSVCLYLSIRPKETLLYPQNGKEIRSETFENSFL